MRNKLSLTFFLICLIAQISLGTTITRSWGKLMDYRGNSTDYGSAMFVDKNGNTYVVGESTGSLENWWYIQKYDPFGTLVWSTPWSFLGASQAHSICADNSGNVYVTGHYSSGLTPNIITVKLSSSGIPQWSRTADGASQATDIGYAITINPNGTVVVGGAITSTNRVACRISYTANGGYSGIETDSNVAPLAQFFTKDGLLVSTGYIPTSNNLQSAAFSVLDSSGAPLFGEQEPFTSTDSFSYLATSDHLGYIYIGTNRVHVENNTQTKRYSIRVFDSAGNQKYGGSEINGELKSISASDPTHYYAAVAASTPAVLQFSLSKVIWTRQLSADKVTAFGTSGVVASYHTGQNNPFGIGLTKFGAKGATLWSTTYSSSGGDASPADVQVVADQLYVVGAGFSSTPDMLLLKYTEGLAITAIGLSAGSVNGGSTLNGSVSISDPAPVGGYAVQLISSLPTVLGVDATLIIPEGGTYAKFVAKTSIVDATYSAVVYARANGVQRAASTLVLPATLKSIVLSQTSVQGGNSVTGTITLSGRTGLSGRRVALGSSDTTAATVPSSVYVPPGASSATFTIATKTVSGQEKTATINAKLGADTRSASLTVTP